MAAPVKKQQELDLRIESLAFGGFGVARVEGFVVFVRRALPGDLVRARITKLKGGYAEAFTLELLEPGPDRVDAPCAHYGLCGGCKLQDLAYDAQAREKEQQVRDALRRIAGIAEPPLEPIVPALESFGYRNKVEFSFTQGEDGPSLGFHRAGRWDQVLELERCWLVSDAVNAVRSEGERWARGEELSAYDQRAHTGYLRHLMVREGRNTGQLLALLVTSPGELPGRHRLVEALRRVPGMHSIHWAVNDRPAEITNLPTELLWGEEAIEEELCGMRFRVRPGAFLQTNTRMAEVLYELARDYAGLTGSETVYDLYAGTGTVGLLLARDALTVWGVEISEESVACAIENAQVNGIANAAYFAGDVGASMEELLDRSGTPDVVVIDPPRAGLSGKALRAVAAAGAERLVYISCNPTTLAGNAKELEAELGYRLERARPVDMFPHTPHVETVARFRLVGS